MDLAKISHELYALPLDDFVAARDGLAAEARKHRDVALAQSIKALAKPTLSAWVVNQMTRHQASDIEQLLKLGAALRTAQENLSGEQLRQLSAQRTAVLKQLSKQAAALALKLDHPISDAVEDEIVATLGAAMADAETARQVREGQLTRSLHYSGFGTVAALVSGPPREPPKQIQAEPTAQRETPSHSQEPHTRSHRQAEARKKLEAARLALEAAELEAAELEREEEALKEAEQALQQARADSENAAEAEREAAQLREQAAARVQQLQDQLAAAQLQLQETEVSLQSARHAQHQAEQQLAQTAQRLRELQA